MMVSDHINYLTFEDPAAVNLVRRALKLAQAGDLYGAAETAGVEITHAAVVSEGLRRGMRYSIGAEVDNDPRSRPDAQNIVDAMKPDGVIRSVHFLPISHPEHGEGWLWPFDNPEFTSLYDVVGVERTWELYIETLVASLDAPAQILGHFYVPAKFGHWPDQEKLEAYEDRIIELCREREIAIELNARAFYRDQNEEQHRRYREANLRLLKKAKAAGVLVAVGSDAHSPRDQGRAFEIVLEMLDEAEINELAFPIGGRLARVALRASKELLEQRRAVAPVAVGSSISGLGRAELAARGVALPPENEASDRSESAARAKQKRAAAAALADAAEPSVKAPRRAKAHAAEAPEPVAGQAEEGAAEAPAAKPKARASARRKAAAEAVPAAEAAASAVEAEPAATALAEPPAAQAPAEPAAAPAAPASEKKPGRAKPAAQKAAAPKTPAPAPASKTPVPKAAASKAPAVKTPASKTPAPKTPAPKAAAKPVAKKPPSKVAATPVKAAAKAAKPAVKKAPAKAAAASRAAVKSKAKPAARTAAKAAPAQAAKTAAAAAAKKPVAPKKAAAAPARAKAASKARKPAAKAVKPASKAAAKAPAKPASKPAAKAASKTAKAKPKAKTSSSKATRKRR